MRRFTLLSNSRTATTLFLSPGPTNTSIAINGSNQPEDCQRQSHILASAERRQRQVRSPDYSVTSSSSAASSTRRPQHRSLAQLRSHLPDEAYFTPSATPGFRLRNAGDSGSADGLDGVGSGGPGQGQGDHKPPDEKTLRLGKSTLSHESQMKTKKKLTHFHLSYSPPNALASPAEYPHHTRPTRDPLSKYLSPPLPINTPILTHRQRPRAVPRRALDRTSSMGIRPHSRQRKTRDPQRTRSPQRRYDRGYITRDRKRRYHRGETSRSLAHRRKWTEWRWRRNIIFILILKITIVFIL